MKSAYACNYPYKSFRSVSGVGVTALDVALNAQGNAGPPFQYSKVGGNLYSLRVTNPNNAVVYVKFYDSPASAVNQAVSTPIAVFPLQAGPGSMLFMRDLDDGILHYSQGLSVTCVANLADDDTTAVSTPPVVEAEWL